jgi:orotate phosphoribosyltransferase
VAVPPCSHPAIEPGYRGHEIHEPQVRGADEAARRVLLVDDAISSGSSVERFAASLTEAGAELAGVFVLVDTRDVADAVHRWQPRCRPMR